MYSCFKYRKDLKNECAEKIPLFQIDAFTNKIFTGNPAAVCVLEKWLDKKILQNMAAEHNLSETAFIVQRKGYYDLRWFTPKTEIDLCGHATLATAFVIFSFFDKKSSCVSFKTLSGLLKVEKQNDILF